MDYLLEEHHSDPVPDVPADDDQLLDLTAAEAKVLLLHRTGELAHHFLV